MKRIYNKWLKGGLLGLLAVFAFASCSDDHFDLNTSNASGTLWENLVATPGTANFAKILEKTIVNKKSYGVPATISYKDLLNSSRVFTVWAPKDGTYDEEKWLKLLEEGKNELVEKQFVRNHIACFNYNGAYATSEKLQLYNQKYAVYDAANNKFMGVDISDGEYKNIASVNGTLHLLEGEAPYSPSLRELIEITPETSDLCQYILDKDTLEFRESWSTPGSTVNGQIQYVDSYFVESNKILPYVAMNEDSLSAAIIPSNTAWQEAIDKISPFYNYKETYVYYDDDAAKYVTDTIKADSLQELYTKEVIFDNMFYSLREQRGFDYTTADVNTVKNFFETADSLVSTAYYYSSRTGHQHAPDCRVLTEGKTPLKGSNGYAFITDHFNFKANKAWQYDIIVEAEYTSYYNQRLSKYYLPEGGLVYHSVTDGNRNDSVKGRVRNNAYIEYVPVNASSKQTVAYDLPSVLSGTYDIYVVIVPENMTDPSNKNPKCNQFNATLQYDLDSKGKASTIKSDKTFKSDPSKVDTILLFENFKFPYCYDHIRNSYQVLSLQVVRSVAEFKTVTTTMYIDCFILKGKDE